MKLLQDKVALITGAARGIGKAIATKYAEAGCHVAISELKVADEAKDYYTQLAQECGVTIRTYESNAADFKLTLITASHCCSLIRRSRPSRVMPALLTRTSSLPKSATICSMS